MPQETAIKTVLLPPPSVLPSAPPALDPVTATPPPDVNAVTVSDYLRTANQPDGIWRQISTTASLQAMSTDRLRVLLEELDAAALPPLQRADRVMEALAVLSDKDPYLAMAMGSKLNEGKLTSDSHQTYSLETTFEKWFNKDRAQAQAWLDQSIQAERLEKKSLHKTHEEIVGYERTVIAAALLSSPQTAIHRLLRLAPTERAAILQSGFLHTASPEGIKNYLQISQQTLEPHEHDEAIFGLAMRFQQTAQSHHLDTLLTAAYTDPASRDGVILKLKQLTHE